MPQTLNYDQAAGSPRGLLPGTLAPPPAGTFEHSRRVPADALRPWIQHYWMVSWKLPTGTSHRAETIPHPNIQLVFDNDGAKIHGVHTSKFSTVLKGSSSVFGVKFRAGAFRHFLGAAVTTIRGRSVPALDVFNQQVLALGRGPAAERIAAANRFFAKLAPPLDQQAQQAGELVDLILKRTDIRTVLEFARLSGVGERALQRLFHQHVGVSPKWVIRRYRMHELIERINSGVAISWADAAADLGYFDQSHLIRDFRRLTGYTPARAHAAPQGVSPSESSSGARHAEV